MTTRASNSLATFWLLVWTLNNIGVTLLNKVAFSVVHFPYPYSLTAIHMAVTWAACHAIFTSIAYEQCQNQKQQSNESSTADTLKPTSSNIWVRLLGDELLQPAPSHGGNRLLVAAFSVLFTLNIAVGNASLQLVSVNFNQIMRSLVPVFTLWCCTALLGHPISLARRQAVWPVVLGVAMAVAGDRLTVSAVGFWTTLACVVLAAAKVVASSELLTGPSYQMHPLRLLHRMALPALGQCIFLAIVTGEVRQLVARWHLDLNPVTTRDWRPLAVVLLSGVGAFSLNICSLQAYKLTSALTCCIAAAVKQVLMIFVGTIMFQLQISSLNGIGIFVVLLASTYYSYVCIAEQVVADKCKVTDDDDDDNDAASQEVATLIPENKIYSTMESSNNDDEEIASLDRDYEVEPLIVPPHTGAVVRR